MKRVSGNARRLVGQWPTAEQFVDELAQRLGQAADDEPDEERPSRLRELASSAGDVARNVFVDVGLSRVDAESLAWFGLGVVRPVRRSERDPVLLIARWLTWVPCRNRLPGSIPAQLDA